MPHCYSLERRLLRHTRAVERGYVVAKPAGHKHILVHDNVAKRTAAVARSMEVHRELEFQSSRHHHSVSKAVLAARPTLPKQVYRSYSNVARAANKARHDRWCDAWSDDGGASASLPGVESKRQDFDKSEISTVADCWESVSEERGDKSGGQLAHRVSVDPIYVNDPWQRNRTQAPHARTLPGVVQMPGKHFQGVRDIVGADHANALEMKVTSPCVGQRPANRSIDDTFFADLINAMTECISTKISDTEARVAKLESKFEACVKTDVKAGAEQNDEKLDEEIYCEAGSRLQKLETKVSTCVSRGDLNHVMERIVQIVEKSGETHHVALKKELCDNLKDTLNKCNAKIIEEGKSRDAALATTCDDMGKQVKNLEETLSRRITSVFNMVDNLQSCFEINEGREKFVLSVADASRKEFPVERGLTNGTLIGLNTKALNGKAVKVTGKDKDTDKLIVQVVSKCTGVGRYGAPFLVKPRNVVDHIPFISLCTECGYGINLNSFPHCEMPANRYKGSATASGERSFLAACVCSDP